MNTVEVTEEFYTEALGYKAIITDLFFTLYEKEFGKKDTNYGVWRCVNDLRRDKFGLENKEDTSIDN